MFTFLKWTPRIFIESLKGFVKDKCFLHGSSLTFYTLLSIVPILAVAFGIAKGFGFEGDLEEELYTRFSNHKEIVEVVLEFARSLLKQAESSYIAGIGVIFLFLFVISLFWSIEDSMNAIWKVKRSRPFVRIITDYLAMMIICPLFFVVASSLTLFVTSHIDVAIGQNAILKKLPLLLFISYRGITLLMIWFLFTCIYLVMPNTRVPTKYALPSALFAGSVYYFVLVAVIKFQIGVSQYNAVYGSFAALPLFLFWLQISWLLVLFGAELAYHAEHLFPALKYAKEQKEITAQTLTILLAYHIVHSFKDGEKKWTLKSLAREFGIPDIDIQRALNPLIDTNTILECKSDNFQTYYLPARDIEEITFHTILQSGNPIASQMLMVNKSEDLEKITKKLSEYQVDTMNLKSNIPISQ